MHFNFVVKIISEFMLQKPDGQLTHHFNPHLWISIIWWGFGSHVFVLVSFFFFLQHQFHGIIFKSRAKDICPSKQCGVNIAVVVAVVVVVPVKKLLWMLSLVHFWNGFKLCSCYQCFWNCYRYHWRCCYLMFLLLSLLLTSRLLCCCQWCSSWQWWRPFMLLFQYLYCSVSNSTFADAEAHDTVANTDSAATDSIVAALLMHQLVQWKFAPASWAIAPLTLSNFIGFSEEKNSSFFIHKTRPEWNVTRCNG